MGASALMVAELVEGPSFLSKKGKRFDKLTANGVLQRHRAREERPCSRCC